MANGRSPPPQPALTAVAASQPVGMLSRPSHAPLAILQELV